MGIGRVWGKEGGEQIKTALMYEIFKNTNNKIKGREIVHPFKLFPWAFIRAFTSNNPDPSLSSWTTSTACNLIDNKEATLGGPPVICKKHLGLIRKGRGPAFSEAQAQKTKQLCPSVTGPETPNATLIPSEPFGVCLCVIRGTETVAVGTDSSWAHAEFKLDLPRVAPNPHLRVVTHTRGLKSQLHASWLCGFGQDA